MVKGLNKLLIIYSKTLPIFIFKALFSMIASIFVLFVTAYILLFCYQA